MTYAVLLSAASHSVREELVEPGRYTSITEAAAAGGAIARASGLAFAVMRQRTSTDPWLQVGTNLTCVEVVRKRWS